MSGIVSSLAIHLGATAIEQSPRIAAECSLFMASDPCSDRPSQGNDHEFQKHLSLNYRLLKIMFFIIFLLSVRFWYNYLSDLAGSLFPQLILHWFSFLSTNQQLNHLSCYQFSEQSISAGKWKEHQLHPI